MLNGNKEEHLENSLLNKHFSAVIAQRNLKHFFLVSNDINSAARRSKSGKHREILKFRNINF